MLIYGTWSCSSLIKRSSWITIPLCELQLNTEWKEWSAVKNGRECDATIKVNITKRQPKTVPRYSNHRVAFLKRLSDDGTFTRTLWDFEALIVQCQYSALTWNNFTRRIIRGRDRTALEEAGPSIHITWSSLCRFASTAILNSMKYCSSVWL